jgi:hypothetical protein
MLQAMDRLIGLTQRTATVSLIAGLVSFLVWGQYEQSWQLTLGLCLSGIGLVAGGFETLFTQRGRLLDWLGQKGDEWGFAFYPWAVVFFLAGLAMLTAGALRVLGLSSAFGEYLSQRPGVAFFAGGIALASAGLATVIGPASWRVTPVAFIVRLPARLLGLLMTVAGLAAIGLGLFEFVAPVGFDAWLQGVFGPFAP